MVKIAKQLPEDFQEIFMAFTQACIERKLSLFVAVTAQIGTAHTTAGTSDSLTIALVKACKMNECAKAAMEEALDYLKKEEAKIKAN